jgi:hypothetical protein
VARDALRDHPIACARAAAAEHLKRPRTRSRSRAVPIGRAPSSERCPSATPRRTRRVGRVRPRSAETRRSLPPPTIARSADGQEPARTTTAVSGLPPKCASKGPRTNAGVQRCKSALNGILCTTGMAGRRGSALAPRPARRDHFS